MKPHAIYGAMCVVGMAVPWFFLIAFLGGGHPSVPLFFSSIFVNNVASSVAADLLISALVLFVFVAFEGRRIGMKRLWVYVPATLLVGLSFGLPLFLYFRERHLNP